MLCDLLSDGQQQSCATFAACSTFVADSLQRMDIGDNRLRSVHLVSWFFDFSSGTILSMCVLTCSILIIPTVLGNACT